jgi:hypothetical protein
MNDKGVFHFRGGMGRFLESMLAALVVLVALIASALGQSTPAQSTPAQSTPAQSTPAQSTASQATSQTTSQNGSQTTSPAPIQRTHASRKPFRAARLTFLTGNVIVEQASGKSQDVAVVNMPLVEGTVLSTGDDGQAEIEFEDGSLVRVTPNSGISLLNLSVDGSGNYQTRVSVLGGLVYAELRAGTKYQYSVDAGADALSPVENTTVRIDLDEPPAKIAVLQGAVHLSSVDGTSTIDADAGQTAQSDADQQGAPFVVKEEIAPETWDQWNEDRDEAALGESGTQTAARDQYAGDQGYGWSDLDASGSWYNIPGQGEVWQPTEADDSASDVSGQDGNQDDAQSQAQDDAQDAALDPGQGFDPYGYGSWVWTPAGYSWASGYGWGWLPYRCGQWVYFNGFGWGWQPGSSCGAYGFGGYGFGGYGFGVNISRAPGFWRHPKRPVTGPGTVHPIVHGPVMRNPITVAHSYGEGRVVRIKTVDGHSIEPLPPVSDLSALHGGTAVGSALKRDYPVNAASHEPVLGIAPVHTASPSSANGRSQWRPGQAYGQSGTRQVPLGRSNMVPALQNHGNQRSRPEPAPRPQSAPVSRGSAPAPAASHSAPAASSSPHK